MVHDNKGVCMDHEADTEAETKDGTDVSE